jgi:hypothetical protein
MKQRNLKVRAGYERKEDQAVKDFHASGHRLVRRRVPHIF